ncbi:hypothetical protein Hte_007737 [Hypoxylon texense]
MAQQGGTYHSPIASPARSSRLQGQDGDKKCEQKTVIEKRRDDARADFDTAVEASPRASSLDDDQGDDQQWAVVTHPDADTDKGPPGQGASSHFDVTLGWGKWKFTLFSLDVSIKKRTGQSS